MNALSVHVLNGIVWFEPEREEKKKKFKLNSCKRHVYNVVNLDLTTATATIIAKASKNKKNRNISTKPFASNVKVTTKLFCRKNQRTNGERKSEQLYVCINFVLDER